MPVLHVFFDLPCDVAIIIELFAEGEIQVMDNHTEHEEALAIIAVYKAMHLWAMRKTSCLSRTFVLKYEQLRLH